MIKETIKEKGIFTTMETETVEQKKMLYNALNNKQESLTEHNNQTVNVVGVIAQDTVFSNGKDDEEDTEDKERAGYKVILVLDTGEMLSGSGNALLSSLDRAIALFGSPSNENPLSFTVKLEKSGKNSMYKYVTLCM